MNKAQQLEASFVFRLKCIMIGICCFIFFVCYQFGWLGLKKHTYISQEIFRNRECVITAARHDDIPQIEFFSLVDQRSPEIIDREPFLKFGSEDMITFFPENTEGLVEVRKNNLGHRVFYNTPTSKTKCIELNPVNQQLSEYFFDYVRIAERLFAQYVAAVKKHKNNSKNHENSLFLAVIRPNFRSFLFDFKMIELR